MKYIVEVKYTNPAHEHVSLRRRVESVSRIVEARSEAEAINRVANQQRALGFMIKEAKIKEAIDPKRYMRPVENQLPAGLDKPKKKPEEANKELAKKEVKEEAEQIEEISKAALRNTDAYKKAMEKIKQKRLNREFGKDSADAENKSDELKMPTKNQSIKIDHRRGRIVGAYREEVEQVGENRAMSAVIAGGSVGSKILTGKMDSNFGYAPNKMPPHLKAAQAKSDALSKVVKRAQAGTLAAKKANEEVEQIEEGIETTHENPLVTVTGKHGVHTHAHLSTANKIHNTKVKHTAVHAGPVKAKSEKGDDLTFTISKHHAKEMKESVEYIEEKLSASDPASKWIHDFVHSDNPKFEGKSKEERIKQALGAYYSAKKANEEVEQVSEAEKKTDEKGHGKAFELLAKHDPEKAISYLSHVAKIQEVEKHKQEKETLESKNKPQNQDDIKLKLNARIPNKYMRNKHVKIHPPFNIMPDRIKRT